MMSEPLDCSDPRHTTREGQCGEQSWETLEQLPQYSLALNMRVLVVGASGSFNKK
jgi:hypothetical protein